MKDFKIFTQIVVFVFFSNSVFAQIPNMDNLTPNNLKSFGKNAQRVGDVYSAIRFYEKFYESNKNNVKVNFELANLYKETRNYQKAKDLYLDVYKKSPKKHRVALFYHAQMLKATGEYDAAIEAFTKFRRANRDSKDRREYSKLIRYEIEGCDSAKAIIEKPLKVNIEQLNSTVNGAHIQFSPISYDETTLYYASLNIDSLVYFDNSNIDTAFPARQFYMAKKEGLDWNGGKEFPLPFNIDGVETGNGVFSRDGQRFYFTRCFKNWQNKPKCDIYVSRLNEGKWSTPEKLDESINHPSYTATQPALGTTSKFNREILYFVSDRPEGKGGLDLWYTVWNPRKETFSTPRNMGLKINTPGDEMTPYFDHLSRTLYFSSNGQPGIGGLDIFTARGERSKWTDPKNIGYPVNSSYDDLYFTVSKSREYGFFTSNRPGHIEKNNEACCDDIYYYRWTDFIKLDVSGQIFPLEKDKYGRKKDYSDFDFFNVPDNINPLKGAIVVLYMEDEELDELIMIDKDTTDKDGNYHFDLLPEKNYKFDIEGFQYFNEEVHVSTEMINFTYTIEMPPIWVNVLNEKPIVLEDILYEFNSAELSQSAQNVIDTTLFIMLTEAPEFIVEVGSHTDSLGTIEYNFNLSQERAEGVVQYLISKGIDESRLIPKGYGAQRPIAPNFLPDGSDNPDGRAKNRRTEFRIVGSLKMQEEELEEDIDF